MHLYSIDAYFIDPFVIPRQYVHTGVPSIITLCNTAHKKQWLCTKTPFKDILNHLIRSNTTILQPVTTLAVQAEQMIEDMGYIYTTLDITSTTH